MSRQQTRSSSDGAIDPSLVQKKRARHRLVGAICLSIIAAVVVPLVLESEPRPVESDLPLEVASPPRASISEPAGDAEPVPAPVAAAGGDARDASAGAHDAAARVPAPSQSAVRPVTPPARSPSKTAAPSGTPPSVIAGVPAVKPGAKAEAKPPARSDEPDVLARLIDRANGAPASAAAGDANKATRKFLVQIGAFSNVQSARSVSDRAVQAGLRPYQETVKTAQGDWIRVRVGPFPTRQDAERAQQELKRAGVTAAIIAL